MAEPPASRKLVDLVFQLTFCFLAGLATIAWLAAIGWVVWQPLDYLIACLFE
jgi:hypothetical protein